MMFIALILGAVHAHVPYFNEAPLIHIKDSQLLQTYHTKGGSHVFEWGCTKGERVYWHVSVPNSFRPSITLVLSGGSTANGLSYSGLSTNGTVQVDACPFQSNYNARLQIAYRMVAQHPSYTCDAVQNFTVSIKATGPTAFTIGVRDEVTLRNRVSTTYHFLAAGSWMGDPCPGTTFLVFGLFVISSNLISKFASDASDPKKRVYFVLTETLLVMLWLVSIISDGLRFVAMQTVDNCDVNKNPHLVVHPSYQHYATKKPEAMGLFVVRLGIAVLAIVTILWTSKVPLDGTGSNIITAAGITAVLLSGSCLLLGIGFGACPLTLAVWIGYHALLRYWCKKETKKMAPFSHMMAFLLPPPVKQQTGAGVSVKF